MDNPKDCVCVIQRNMLSNLTIFDEIPKKRYEEKIRSVSCTVGCNDACTMETGCRLLQDLIKNQEGESDELFVAQVISGFVNFGLGVFC